ncbi:MAG: translocated intimin receptor Tir [Acidobacteria bacterium]|nr:translocated intimin receptor Tir [Acidobacteriota bacterium]
MKPSLVSATLTDVQFWIPVAVLILGIGLLVLLS